MNEAQAAVRPIEATSQDSSPQLPDPSAAKDAGAENQAASEAKAAPVDTVAPRPTWRPVVRSKRVIVLAVGAAIAAVLIVLAAWRLPPFGGGAEVTDNAYVRGRTAVIAPQVSGYVVEVPVKDFADIQAGDVLVRIDDRIYRARLEQARATLDAREAELANNRQAANGRRAALAGRTAELASATALADRAGSDFKRVEKLITDGAIAQKDYDQASAAHRQAEAAVAQARAAGQIAREDIRSTEVSRDALVAAVESARAAVRLAEIDLENTVIRAPESGQLGEIGVRRGQYVTNGTLLLSLVPDDRWVIANYKETQTTRMAAGQRAVLRVDALGGAEVTGRVERVAPAAGSEFAVLKPDNATGNFVKVPQRIGVRIALDPGQGMLERLRPGMSVEARVDTHGVQ
jgi:multidrug resistance efflux pump